MDFTDGKYFDVYFQTVGNRIEQLVEAYDFSENRGDLQFLYLSQCWPTAPKT